MGDLRLLNKRFKQLLQEFEKTKHECLKAIKDDQPTDFVELKKLLCADILDTIKLLEISVWKKTFQLDVQIYEFQFKTGSGQHIQQMVDKKRRYQKFCSDLAKAVQESMVPFYMEYAETDISRLLCVMLAMRISNQ